MEPGGLKPGTAAETAHCVHRLHLTPTPPIHSSDECDRARRPDEPRERAETTTKSMLYTCPCTEPTTANAKTNGKHKPARASTAYIQYVPRRYRSAAYRILARADCRQSLAQGQEVKRKQKKRRSSKGIKKSRNRNITTKRKGITGNRTRGNTEAGGDSCKLRCLSPGN